MRITIIDPPSGWKYGFPRKFDWNREKQTLPEWLVSKGYPAKDAEWAADHCRYWETDDAE